MWRFIQRFFIGLSFVIGGYLLIGAIALDTEYTTERSVTINASAEQVYEHLIDLRTWTNWAAWMKNMPEGTELQFNSKENGVGVSYEYTAPQGFPLELTLTNVKANSEVRFQVRGEEVVHESDGVIVLKENEGKTTLTWTTHGRFTEWGFRYVAWVAAMGEASRMEQTLAGLKHYIENPPEADSSESGEAGDA